MLQFEGLKFEGFCQPYRDACEILNVSCVASQLSLTQKNLSKDILFEKALFIMVNMWGM